MSASETSSSLNLHSGFRRARLAATSLFFINGIIVGGWAPHIPGFMSRLGIGEFALGFLMLGYGLGALAAMTAAGQLIARVGARKTFRLFFFPVFFLMPFAAEVSNPWMGAAVLALFGAAIGGIDVAMNANVVAVERQSGRATMSTAHGCWSLGAFVGGALGGLGIEMLGALQQSFVILLAAALLYLPFDMHITETTEPPQKKERKAFVWPNQPSIYVVAVIALLCMSAEGAVLNWSTLFLQNELFANTGIVGLGFAGFSAAMALTRFLGDGMRNRFGAVAVFRLSGAVAAVGMLCASLSPWPWLSIASFALSGIGMANLVPILLSAAGKQPGLNSGVSVSFVTTISHMGLLLVPSLIGFVAGHAGLAPVYAAFAVLIGATIFMAGRVATADDNQS